MGEIVVKINVIVDFLKSPFISGRDKEENPETVERYPEEKQISSNIINCEKVIHYHFNDKSLLVSALKHRSFLSVTREQRYLSNERLEFLGDAVLELITTRFLYFKYPEKSEGELSKMKAILVSKKVLSKVARKLDLGRYVLLNYGEEKSGGRERLSILADTFEAILGAIYLDSDYGTAEKFVHKHLLNISGQFLQSSTLQNYKSRLLEYSQARGWGIPEYFIISENGPDHDKIFEIGVKIGERELSTGTGPSKKAAEQAAARKSMERLKK